MSFFEKSLSKLEIRAYFDSAYERCIGNIEAMYNPETITLQYGASVERRRGINEQVEQSEYKGKTLGNLELTLEFDASLPGNEIPVQTQIETLRALCFNEVRSYEKSEGEIPYLRIIWGSFTWNGDGYFSGRCTDLRIEYTMFDRDATPLRALAHISFCATRNPEKQASELGLATNQVGSARVPDATNLPMLADAPLVGIGESVKMNYLDIAFANNLDSLDALQAGTTLIFPAWLVTRNMESVLS